MTVNVDALTKQIYDKKVASIPGWKRALTTRRRWGTPTTPGTWMYDLWKESKRIAQMQISKSTFKARNSMDAFEQTKAPNLSVVEMQELMNSANGTFAVDDLNAFTRNKKDWNRLVIDNPELADLYKERYKELIDARVGNYTSSYGDLRETGNNLESARLDQLRKQRIAQASGYRYDPTKVKQTVTEPASQSSKPATSSSVAGRLTSFVNRVRDRLINARNDAQVSKPATSTTSGANRYNSGSSSSPSSYSSYGSSYGSYSR